MSTSTAQIDVPFFRRSTVGGRAFPVAVAKVWNSLPSDVSLRIHGQLPSPFVNGGGYSF